MSQQSVFCSVWILVALVPGLPTAICYVTGGRGPACLLFMRILYATWPPYPYYPLLPWVVRLGGGRVGGGRMPPGFRQPDLAPYPYSHE